MRKYDAGDEQKIRTERLVCEWGRSGFLEQMQVDRIVTELKVDLRRTNMLLRLVLFGFGILIIGAAIVLVGITLRLRDDDGVGMLCFASALGCVLLAEFLVEKFKLYRFGIEEAAAVGAAILTAMGTGFIVSSMHLGGISSQLFVALMAGSIGFLAIYLRFGYVYAAIGSMACLSAMPLSTSLTELPARVLAAGLLLPIAMIARLKRSKVRDQFPAEDYLAIEAVAWLGIYALINLHLYSVVTFRGLDSRFTPLDGLLYWLTYGAIWLLPALGIYLALLEKSRPLLDVSLALALLTLASNKPYLGASSETWDPILLGLLLIGTAVAVRRWLSKGENGQRHGYTADRILKSDDRAMMAVGVASAALHMAGPTQAHPSANPEKFKGGGGRSGGGGAGGSF
jgi:hypothetical protein